MIFLYNSVSNIICSFLLRNFLKSVQQDGDHTQDHEVHDSNWNISNAVIGRVNKIRIYNALIYSTYQYKKLAQNERIVLYIKALKLNRIICTSIHGEKAEHVMIEIIVEALLHLKL